MKSGDVILFSSPLASTTDLEFQDLQALAAWSPNRKEEARINQQNFSVSFHPPGVT